MSGKRHGFHSSWQVGFDDDGRILALDATLTADGGWSLDLSEPVLARAMCHIDNAYWIPNIRGARPDREDQQDVADRVPRLRRAAGHAGHRGHPRPVRACCSGSTPASCAAATSTGPARPRRTGSRCGTRSGWSGSGARSSRPATSSGGWAEIERVQRRRTRTRKRALAMTPVKFGISFNLTAFNQAGRARARLQGRLGADQPRRHRDGPGPAHEDAAGRRHRARAPAVGGPAGADPHRQGAQHLGHRG